MKIYKNLLRHTPALLALLLHPAVAGAETLQDSVNAALSSHPAIQGAKAESESAAQDKREQRSGYFPKVSMTVTGGRIYGDNATSRGLSTTRGAGYSGLGEGSIAARETIFDGFQTKNRVESAKSRKLSADMNVLDVSGNTAFRTSQAYIDLLRASEALSLLKDHSKKVDDYLGRIKKAVDSGSSDEAEHQQARDIRVILDGLIDDYEGQKQVAESNYFSMTGRMPQGNLVVPEMLSSLPASVEDALMAARDHHPSVSAARYSSDASGYDIKAEKGPLYPEVEGELSYLKSDKRDLIGGELEDGRAVLHVNWDFDTGGAQLARISRKKYEHVQAVSKAEEAERNVELGVRLAWSEYETAKKQIENQDQRRALNEKLFNTYKVQFEGAKISLLQLMQADNQLFTTGLEKINGKYRLLAAQYGVLASMGRLPETLKVAAAPNPLTHAEP